MDGFATDSASFFGSGGISRPSGVTRKLGNDLGSKGESSALLLEREFELHPGESRTLCFLYGDLPEGFQIDELVKKYSADPSGALARSSTAWKADGLHFSVPAEPWVEREIAWHNYYLRGAMTYDSFFREHILSQGHV
jgi:cellobiose phosphorylase